MMQSYNHLCAYPWVQSIRNPVHCSRPRVSVCFIHAMNICRRWTRVNASPIRPTWIRLYTSAQSQIGGTCIRSFLRYLEIKESNKVSYHCVSSRNCVNIDGTGLALNQVPLYLMYRPLMFVTYTLPVGDILRKHNICFHVYADCSIQHIPFKETLSPRDIHTNTHPHTHAQQAEIVIKPEFLLALLFNIV